MYKEDEEGDILEDEYRDPERKWLVPRNKNYQEWGSWTPGQSAEYEGVQLWIVVKGANVMRL